MVGPAKGHWQGPAPLSLSPSGPPANWCEQYHDRLHGSIGTCWMDYPDGVLPRPTPDPARVAGRSVTNLSLTNRYAGDRSIPARAPSQRIVVLTHYARPERAVQHITSVRTAPALLGHTGWLDGQAAHSTPSEVPASPGDLRTGHQCGGDGTSYSWIRKRATRAHPSQLQPASRMTVIERSASSRVEGVADRARSC